MFKIESFEFALEVCRLESVAHLLGGGGCTVARQDTTSESPEPVQISFRGGRDPADVVQLRLLRWDDDFRLSVWALDVITSVLKRRR